MDMTKFKGVIFDLDGTLIDSAHVWSDIDINFLTKRGIEMPDDYAKMVSTMNFTTAAEYTRDRFGLDERPEDMIDEWFDMALYEYSHNIKAKPHAAEFLRGLKEAGVKLALATASSRELYTAVLKNNGIYDCFDFFASTDQVKRGKGFPDIYLLGAQELGAAPSDCAVFEDIIEGVRAAKSGGFFAAAVLNGVFPEDEQLLQREADLCFSDYAELLRRD